MELSFFFSIKLLDFTVNKEFKNLFSFDPQDEKNLCSLKTYTKCSNPWTVGILTVYIFVLLSVYLLSINIQNFIF